MAAITVRVGASRDASLTTVFQPLIEASRRAKAIVAKDAEAAGGAVDKGARKGVDEAEKAFAELAKESARWQKQMAKDADRSEADRVKSAERSMRDKAKLMEDEAHAFERSETRKVKAAERANAAVQKSTRDANRGQVSAGNFSYDTRGLGKSAARVAAQVGRTSLDFGKRVSSDVLSGEGVDTSLSSLVSKNTSLDKRSAQISNSGYIPGAAGANGQRQDVAGISSQVMSVAKATATDTESISTGLQNFVGLTGDLETGRKLLKDMAVLSKATGSDMGEMGLAAANLAARFKDMPNRAELTLQALKGIAAQGKVGAVEISDMATQMAKIGAASTRFEGDSSKNLAFFSAMSQMARDSGGASSPTMAATATAGFSDVFTKNARQKAFSDFDVKTAGAPGKIRNAEDILLDSFKAAATKNGGMKNFIPNLGKMYATQTSQRAIGGFSSLYADTYNKTQGTEQQKLTAATLAVREEIDRLANVTMGATEEMGSFKVAMAQTDSKATELSLSLQESSRIVSGALDQVLYPAIENAAKAFNVFSGVTGGKGNADANSARVEGNNATPAIAHAIQTGKISKEDLALFNKADADQKAAIQQQQAASHESTTEKWTRRALSHKYGIGYVADAIAGEDVHKNYVQAEQQGHSSAQLNVVELTKQNAQLVAAMKELTDHMKNGTVKVTDASVKPPAVDQAGRAHPGPVGTPRTPRK